MAGGEDFAVEGREKLVALGKQLRAASDKDGAKSITNALRREVRDATKETRTAIKKSALENLPSKGGLNRWAASTPGATTRLYGRNTSVRISMRKQGHDLAALNRGRLRHPLFGRRTHWYQQEIAPGFFTKPVEENADALRQRVVDAINAAAERAARL
jgi:hypothetical protein